MDYLIKEQPSWFSNFYKTAIGESPVVSNTKGVSKGEPYEEYHNDNQRAGLFAPARKRPSFVAGHCRARASTGPTFGWSSEARWRPLQCPCLASSPPARRKYWQGLHDGPGRRVGVRWGRSAQAV